MNQPSNNSPIVCRLSDPEFREREATLLAAFRCAVTAIVELPEGYAFQVNGDENSLLLAAQLMAAERVCCPFLTFELTAQPNLGPVIVRVTGPGGTKEFLKTILLPPEPAL